MPQRCSVPGCYSTYTNTYGVSFHTFPTEERVRQQWVRVCAPKIPNNAVLDHLRVCSLHFPQEDFIVNYRRAGPRLRRDAVPCIFTPDPRDTPDHVLALPRKAPRRRKSSPTPNKAERKIMHVPGEDKAGQAWPASPVTLVEEEEPAATEISCDPFPTVYVGDGLLDSDGECSTLPPATKRNKNSQETVTKKSQAKNGPHDTETVTKNSPAQNGPHDTETVTKDSPAQNGPHDFPKHKSDVQHQKYLYLSNGGGLRRLIPWNAPPDSTSTPASTLTGTLFIPTLHHIIPGSALQVNNLLNSGTHQDSTQPFHKRDNKLPKKKKPRGSANVRAKKNDQEIVEVINGDESDTNRPALVSYVDPEVVNPQRKKRSDKQSSDPLRIPPPDHLGLFEELLTGQNNTAAAGEGSGPNNNMLTYLPWLMPQQPTGTASTVGVEEEQASPPPVSPGREDDVEMIIEEVQVVDGEEEEQVEDDAHDPLSLDTTPTASNTTINTTATTHNTPNTTINTPTTTKKRPKSAHKPQRIETPPNTNPLAGSSSTSVGVIDSSNATCEVIDLESESPVDNIAEENNDDIVDEDDDGDDVWQSVNFQSIMSLLPPFNATPGPKNISRLMRPVDYVRLLITPDFMRHVAVETNKYARYWVTKHKKTHDGHRRHLIKTWQMLGPTTSKELYVFLAVTMNMSLVMKPTIPSYWDHKNRSQATPWFEEHFDLDRYILLLKFLRFADCNIVSDSQDPVNKLHSLQPLVKHFSRVFERYFRPYRDVTLAATTAGCDSMEQKAWLGSCIRDVGEPDLEVIESEDGEGEGEKEAESTIKIWYLSDVKTGYIITFEVDIASAKKMHKEDEVYDLVMRLMETGNVLYEGYHLHVDGCSVFPQLLFDLWKCQTLVTGKVQPYHKSLPQGLVKGRFIHWQVRKQKKGPLFCIRYDTVQEKKLLLSTVSCTDFVNYKRPTKGKPKPLPSLVKEHRKATNTTSFQMYIPKCSTLKSSTRVALSVISTAFLNAYLLYTATSKDVPTISKHSFLVAAIEELTEGHTPLRM